MSASDTMNRVMNGDFSVLHLNGVNDGLKDISAPSCLHLQIIQGISSGLR